MAIIYRPWISPYRDEDFEWDRRKSLATFADRDFVFEAVRLIFRGPLVRRQDARRRRTREPRFMVLGEFVRPSHCRYLYPALGKMPDHLDAACERGRACDIP